MHFLHFADAVPPVLSAPVPFLGHFQFTLSGETNAPYIIETSTNLQNWKAVRTNNEALASRSIVVEALEQQAFYRARQAAPFFGYAIATIGKVNLNGSSLITDSFDSGDPSYSTNGRYDSAKAKDGGDVAAYAGVTNSTNFGTALIYGHLSTGFGAFIALGSNGAVGSTDWHLSGNTGIEPGWSSDDMNVDFPNVKAPFM